MMMRIFKFCSPIFILFMASSFFSCAFDLAHVDYDTAIIVNCLRDCPSFKIIEEQRLSNMPCGYNRTLKKDSEWKLVGAIDAGDVYKPLNQCFTVECSNVFEAYLVMKEDELNGFYLPVEDGYVDLSTPVKINLRKQGE